MDRRPLAQYYTPVLQSDGLGGRLMIRTAGDPMDQLPSVKRVVQSIDPQVPVENAQTLESLRAGRLTSPRLIAALLGIFALAALAITVTGLAAVIATFVSQRTREFGLRMALGASNRSVLTMVLRQGVRLVAIGLAAGAGLAIVFGRVLMRYLYETRPADPLVLLAVAALLLIAAAVACVIPARRAISIDPLRALKSE